MAERRDLLKGRYLSPVQIRALEILNFLDEIEKLKTQYDLFRSALVGSGSYLPKAIWPEYQKLFGEEKQEDPQVREMDDVATDDSTAHFDYSNVEWKSPSEGIEEYESLMAKVASLSTGSFTGDTLTKFSGQGEWR